ncbi:MAG: TRAP transporter substrate-binding protein DctP [Chloroflexota bacterium]
MQRRAFLKKAGVGLAAGMGLAAGVAAPSVHAQATIRWRCPSSFPKTVDTLYNAAETFAKLVGEMSGGKFTISVHGPGELMPPLGVLDGVQNGTVECGHSGPIYYIGKDPTFALGGAIPFGLNARQMTAWMYDGNGMKLMREFYKNYDVTFFPLGDTGTQMGGWFRKEIKSVADLKGLKFRTGGFCGQVLQPLGVVVQSIAPSEIYTALEKGTIDAVEYVGPYDDLKLGFYKVAPHYYYPGWWEGSVQTHLYVNIKAYEALPAEYKAMVEAAASHAHVQCLAKYDARNPAALKQLVAGGAKLHRFPRDVMEASFKGAMKLYKELSAKNANWKTIYEDYAKFRTDENMWFRFAEASFDNFMQAQKL